MHSSEVDEYKYWLGKVDRDGIQELTNFLFTKTDIETCPASSKYHSDFDGGLIHHSLKVLELLAMLYKQLRERYFIEEISNQSIILVALTHDLAKLNSYSKETCWWKDDNNKWQSYMGYKNIDNELLGHGSKSLSIVQDFIKLNIVEKQSILFHMGHYDTNDKQEVMKVFNNNKLAKLLHIADNLSLVIEETIDYRNEKK